MFREGLVVVVSGPSGVGKGTLLKQVRQDNGNIRFSVSATTRKPRAGELEGQNYFFKSVEQFQEMIENRELIEWVEYCGNYYGTPKEYINDSVKQGYDIILEIEVEGAVNIKKQIDNCVTLFILPPSFDDLKKRIVGRGTEDECTINTRLETAKREIAYVDKYDYIIINNDINTAVNEINSILTAEKLKYSRNSDILQYIGFKQT